MSCPTWELEPKFGLLQEQQALLTVEPFLQAFLSVLYKLLT